MQQLELNLRSTDGNRCFVNHWTYRFAKNAMIEELGKTRHIYGLWEGLFGCWEVDIETNKSREIIPTWIILNPNGVWRDNQEFRFPASLSLSTPNSAKWRYQANAAFAGFLSGIPQRIRTVAAGCGQYQWLALDLIWQRPGFAQFLDEELFSECHQFLFCCFSLARADLLSRKKRSELTDKLMSCKRLEVLSELSGVTCTKQTLRAIYKLGDQPADHDVYQTIIKFVAHPDAAKTLSHVTTIDPLAITFLSFLPDELLLPNIIRAFLDDPEAATADAPFILLANIYTQAPFELKARARDGLNKVQSYDQFRVWAFKWEETFSEILNFPPPPIKGHGRLRPITSANEMRKESLAMQNCLDSCIPEILAGFNYYFHWDGEERATIGLEKYAKSGWSYDMALGFDNQSLTYETETQIRELIQRELADQRASSD